MPKKQAKQEHLVGEAEVVRAAEIARKRAIVTDKFYPALTAATTSVDEAKMLISSIASTMMEEVLKTMKDRKFKDIKDTLLKRLCPEGSEEGARSKEVSDLLDVFAEEDLYVSRELIEGMNQAIEQMIQEEMRARTLNSFTPNWDKYLRK